MDSDSELENNSKSRPKKKEPEQFYYSEKYEDDEYEYRHVHVPKKIAKTMPWHRLLTESECYKFGIQQSPGWVNYMIHKPERHILLFRRPLPNTELQRKTPYNRHIR